MTAIAGVEYDGGVVIGGDSAATWDDFGRVSLTSDKVWKSGEWLFGECGGVRSGQLMRYSFKIPNIPDDSGEELEEFLCTDFMDTLRAVLVDSGVVESRHAIENLDNNSTYLVGVRGQLWLLDEDFGVVRSSGGYWATGCGKDLALGSLHSTEEWEDPVSRVEAALEAAAAHNSAVMGPFTIIDLPYEPV